MQLGARSHAPAITWNVDHHHLSLGTCLSACGIKNSSFFKMLNSLGHGSAKSCTKLICAHSCTKSQTHAYIYIDAFFRDPNTLYNIFCFFRKPSVKFNSKEVDVSLMDWTASTKRIQMPVLLQLQACPTRLGHSWGTIPWRRWWALCTPHHGVLRFMRTRQCSGPRWSSTMLRTRAMEGERQTCRPTIGQTLAKSRTSPGHCLKPRATPWVGHACRVKSNWFLKMLSSCLTWICKVLLPTIPRPIYASFRYAYAYVSFGSTFPSLS